MQSAVSRRTVLALASIAWAGSGAVALAAPVSFTVQLTGADQVPPVQTSGTGSAALTWDPSTRRLTWSVTYSGLADVTMAHFHGPAAAGKNGGVLVWISKRGTPPTGTMTGAATLTAAQARELTAGDWYINIHTKDHPAGAIRGQVIVPKS